jgi:hypothetical protein
MSILAPWPAICAISPAKASPRAALSMACQRA